MSEMIERVACAMAKVNVHLWDFMSENERAPYRALARAAIAALREPTETMAMAGFLEYANWRYDDGDIAPSFVPAVYQAMLDEAGGTLAQIEGH